MAIDLPDVVQRWEASVQDYLAAMQEVIGAARDAAEANLEAAAAVKTLQGVIDDLHGKTVDLGIDAAGANAAAESVAALGRIEAILAHELRDVSADAMMQTASLRTMAESMKIVQRDTADASLDLMLQTQILIEMRDAWLQNAGAITIYNAAARDAGNGAVRAAAGFRIWGTGIRLTGAALHWIVAGTLEFLAVAVPAAIALGAGMMVAAQGAQNAATHMNALYTATEATHAAFGQTVGSVLGLGSALQKAQDAANPGVYEILGSVVNDAKTRFGDLATAGLQVVHMFDEFSARVTVDLQGALGGQIHGLLAGMVTDLLMLGQVLGNLGHAFLNFAAAMPGLARVLLAIADAVSRVILFISSIPAPILTAVFALEEFYRWGGLALRMLIGLTAAAAGFPAWLAGASFIARFGASLQTVIRGGGLALIWAGQMVSRLAGLSEGFAAAGTAMAEAGAGMATFAASMSPLAMAGFAGYIALATAGLGYMIYKLHTAKDAAQQWVAASGQMVAKASDMSVLNVIYGQMAQTLTRVSAAQAQAGNAAAGAASSVRGGLTPALAAASTDAQALSQHLVSLWQQAQTVTGNARNLASTLHLSVPAAMMAAQQAGVNLQSSMAKGGQAFAIAAQQIRNYLTGIAAMGTPMGTLGADVQALGIASQLASSKVSQLNSAWDAWISSVTGGVQAMSQVQTALAGMSQDAVAASASLTGTISSVTRAAQGSTYTLRGFGQAAMQSWQQFASAITQGNTALDSLRTGMAEGVVSNKQFESTVHGLVGEMIPFTQGNRAAVSMLSQLAHEAGGPTTTSLKTLQQWAGVTGNTARDQFAGGMLAASIAMGNMAKVAQNLSAVVGQQLNSAMAAAIITNSHLNAAVEQYAHDLANANTPASVLQADIARITSAMASANSMIARGSAGMSAAAASAARMGAAVRGATGNVVSLEQAIANLHSKSITITTYLQSVGLGSRGGHTGTGPVGYSQHGTPSAPAGPMVVGEAGPELLWLLGGERIMSNPETRQFLDGGGGTGSGGLGSGGPQVIHLDATIDNHVTLDGQEVWRGQQRRTMQYNVRNSGGQPTGRVVPGR